MDNLTVLRSIKKSQSFVFSPGLYEIELSGAQGGIGREDGVLVKPGGLGAKVNLLIKFSRRIELFFFVGSKGNDGSSKANTVAQGGWNGGGNGGKDLKDNDGSGAGGGSTDLRWINSESTSGINSRIAVAAGGSGSAFGAFGAPGGDLMIYSMNKCQNKDGFVRNSEKPSSSKNKLLNGADGKSHESTPSSGAGGGYYGGTAVNGGVGLEYPRTGTGGSSYVAGCYGKDDATVFLGKNGIEIRNWAMTPGFSEIGNEGDGIAKIWKVSSSDCHSCPFKLNSHFISHLSFLFLMFI